jgi:Protein of unknown function (DUF3619)
MNANLNNHLQQNTARDERQARFAYQIKAALNESSRQVDGDIAAKLRAARQKALAKQRAEIVHVPVLAGAGAGFSFNARPAWLRWAANLVPLAVLLLGLAGIHTWHQLQRAEEFADIDAAVLADDVPLNVYTDKGFGQFLERARQ